MFATFNLKYFTLCGEGDAKLNRICAPYFQIHQDVEQLNLKQKESWQSFLINPWSLTERLQVISYHMPVVTPIPIQRTIIKTN